MKIRRIGDEWKEKYGEKIYKLSLATGCTCPNRDGSKGVGGCIFCSEKGSGDFARYSRDDLTRRIRQAKELVKAKGATKYVAYFQSFTNTYGKAERLEPLFTRAAMEDDIVEVSIATRCDCLGDDILDMLERIAKIKPLTVELGLQSMHRETLERINCKYTLEEFDDAIRHLKERNITTVAHLILGFSWESREQMIESARHVGEVGADGVKLQLLHVLKGTKLGEEYQKQPFRILTLEEYTSIVVDCLKAMPADMVIHRLTGDGSRKDLLAPMWSTDKKRVLNTINRRIERAER